MILQELKQLKTGRGELGKFGLTIGGVFLGLGLWFLYRHKAHYPYFLYSGLLLLVLGLAVPRSLKPVYIGWMALGFCLGLIVSTILLTVFFYLVVTPIGLAARCAGKDFLQRKWDAKATTYWLPRKRAKPKEASEYEQQF
jgi:hypothetical protein